MIRMTISSCSITVAIWLSCALVFSVIAGQVGPVRVTYQIVDDVGTPVKGSVIHTLSSWKKAKSKGVTDKHGLFSYKDTIFISLGCRVQKEGYYDSFGEVWTHAETHERLTSPFTVTQKRIIDPVVLVKKEVRARFPRLDEAIGFDLEMGDWVAPDGKGKTADIMLKAARRWVSVFDMDYTVDFVFPNADDGLLRFTVSENAYGMKSDLVPPHRAPDNGYTNQFQAFIHRTEGIRHASYSDGNRWVFRVRTVRNEEGEITSVHYGWMTRDIAASPTKDTLGYVSLFYYWNPDSTSRSLEPKEIAERQGLD